MEKIYHPVLGDYSEVVDSLKSLYNTKTIENDVLIDELAVFLNENLTSNIVKLKQLHLQLENNNEMLRKIRGILALLEKITETKIGI